MRTAQGGANEGMGADDVTEARGQAWDKRMRIECMAGLL
jgi:hypothetical protein